MDLLAYFSDFSITGLIVLALTVVAMLLLGIQNKNAFIVFTISQLIQIYIFYEKKQGFLILTMLILIFLNITTYFKWSRSSNDSETSSRDMGR